MHPEGPTRLSTSPVSIEKVKTLADLAIVFVGCIFLEIGAPFAGARGPPFSFFFPLQHQHQIHKTTMPSKGVGADTCSEVESIGRLKCKKLDPEVVEGARRMRHEAAAPRKCPAPGGLTRPPAPPRGPQRIVDSTAAAAAAPNRYCLQAFVRGARRMRHAAAVPHQDPAPGPRTSVPPQSPAPGPP